MSDRRVSINETYLEDTADAIRYANGSESTYTPAQFENAIKGLKKVLVPLTANDNGEYDPDDYDADGFSGVTVYVQGGGGSAVLIEKTITANGTYLASSDNADGFSKVIVEVPPPASDFEFEYPDYVTFTGVSITLPFKISDDYMITVDFDNLSYTNNRAVIGNSSGPNYVHLTMFNNKWYTSTGSSEGNFSGSTTGRHTYVINKNGGNWFDGAQVTNYTPTNQSNVSLIVGGRASGASNYTGKLYSYKIESISTGETICNLIPAIIKYRNTAIVTGLYDTINGALYTANLTAGYDAN